MATANDILNVAKKEIGYSRWEDPQEGTKYGRWYAKITGDSYYGTSGVPYCAMFVSWVFAQAGQAEPFLPKAYCPYIVNSIKANGMQVSCASAKPGDVVLFDWGKDGESDHVGIVESNGNGVLYTIEGNTDNGCVKRKTRSYSDVCCVGRPKFTVPEQIKYCIIWGSNGGSNQKWKLEPQSDGSVIIASKTGLVLDVAEGKAKNGTYVIAYKRNGGKNQKWFIEGNRIRSALGNFYLDVYKASDNPGTYLEIYEPNDSDAQKWAFLEGSDGWITIINNHTYRKNALDIKGGA